MIGGANPIEQYLHQVMEVVLDDIAYVEKPPTPKDLEAEPAGKSTRNEFHREKVAPEKIQIILHLRKEGASISAIATRFHVGSSTIRRVLEKYAGTAHVPHYTGVIKQPPARYFGDAV